MVKQYQKLNRMRAIETFCVCKHRSLARSFISVHVKSDKNKIEHNLNIYSEKAEGKGVSIGNQQADYALTMQLTDKYIDTFDVFFYFSNHRSKITTLVPWAHFSF